MILEGLVTSVSRSGELNIAPMGPIVDESMSWLHLRPFQTSQTYRNLAEHPQGVLHVIDDVLLLAKAAIGRLDETPETFPAEKVSGRVLSSACRWCEFEVESIDATHDRTDIRAKVVYVGRLRDVFGFNRAKHAVIEAAILATRVHLLDPKEIMTELDRLASPVAKTGAQAEREAFDFLKRYISSQLPP